METTPVAIKRSEFTQRLRDALATAGIRPSPTVLAREFNLRSGTFPITTHAARKWLFEGSVPTQAKLVVLSDLLGVTPQWLRFGTCTLEEQMSGTQVRIPHDIVMLVQDVKRLDRQSRQLVDSLVETMLKMQKA